MARRIQTTLLSPLGAAPAAPAPQFAAKPLLTDVLTAKYVPAGQQQSQPPESAFKPHTQYNSPYEDQGLKELAEKIKANKKKQNKRWKKMIKKIKKREKARLAAEKSSKKVTPVSLEPKANKKVTSKKVTSAAAAIAAGKKIPASMAKCKELQPVKTQVKGHKRQTYKCLDKPAKKTQKKKQAGSKKSKAKKQQGSKKKTKKAKVAFEPEPLVDIKELKDFKNKAARKFASFWPGKPAV